MVSACLPPQILRRGAGVAEQGCLLSSCTGKTGAGGSNPPLSAYSLSAYSLSTTLSASVLKENDKRTAQGSACESAEQHPWHSRDQKDFTIGVDSGYHAPPGNATSSDPRRYHDSHRKYDDTCSDNS